MMCLKVEVLLKISKKLNKKPKFVIPNPSKIRAVQLWNSAVSQKISAKAALFQRSHAALKVFVFSAVQSSISAVQRLSGNEKRSNRPEIFLNQSLWALRVSETSARETKSLKRKISLSLSLFLSVSLSNKINAKNRWVFHFPERGEYIITYWANLRKN